MRKPTVPSFFQFGLFGLAGALAFGCSSGEKSSSPTMAAITSGCAGGSPVPDSCCTGGKQVSFTGDCSLTGSSVQPVKAALTTGATTAGNAQKALDAANKMVDPNGANNGTALAATAGSAKSGNAGPAARVENPSGLPGFGAPGVGGAGSGSGSSGGGSAGGGGGGLGDVKTAAALAGPGQPQQLLGESGGGAAAGGGGGAHHRHGDSAMGDLFGNGGGMGAAGANGGKLQYGAVAGADGKAMSVQDPEDYFDRLTANDNLFTVVERRYRKTTMDWATAQTQQILHGAQKQYGAKPLK